MIPKLSARSFLFEYLLVRKKQNFYSWCRVGRPVGLGHASQSRVVHRWREIWDRPSTSTIDHRPSREKSHGLFSAALTEQCPPRLVVLQTALHASRFTRRACVYDASIGELVGGHGGEWGPRWHVGSGGRAPWAVAPDAFLAPYAEDPFPYHLRRLVLYTWSGWEYVVAGVVGPLEDDRSSAG